MSPDELKSLIPFGLLSIPLTDFNGNDEFDAKASARRLEWLLGYKTATLYERLAQDMDGPKVDIGALAAFFPQAKSN